MKPDLSEVLYRIDEEGFDYCFRGYSSFTEFKDEEFHRLRQIYIDAADALEEYVTEHSSERRDVDF